MQRQHSLHRSIQVPQEPGSARLAQSWLVSAPAARRERFWEAGSHPAWVHSPPLRLYAPLSGKSSLMGRINCHRLSTALPHPGNSEMTYRLRKPGKGTKPSKRNTNNLRVKSRRQPWRGGLTTEGLPWLRQLFFASSHENKLIMHTICSLCGIQSGYLF